MDKESINKRREDLVGGATKLRETIDYLAEQLTLRQNDLIATDAAIRECDFWLEQIGNEARDIFDPCKILSDDPAQMGNGLSY